MLKKGRGTNLGKLRNSIFLDKFKVSLLISSNVTWKIWKVLKMNSIWGTSNFSNNYVELGNFEPCHKTQIRSWVNERGQMCVRWWIKGRNRLKRLMNIVSSFLYQLTPFTRQFPFLSFSFFSFFVFLKIVITFFSLYFTFCFYNLCTSLSICHIRLSVDLSDYTHQLMYFFIYFSFNFP